MHSKLPKTLLRGRTLPLITITTMQQVARLSDQVAQHFQLGRLRVHKMQTPFGVILYS